MIVDMNFLVLRAPRRARENLLSNLERCIIQELGTSLIMGIVRRLCDFPVRLQILSFVLVTLVLDGRAGCCEKTRIGTLFLGQPEVLHEQVYPDRRVALYAI